MLPGLTDAERKLSLKRVPFVGIGYDGTTKDYDMYNFVYRMVLNGKIHQRVGCLELLKFAATGAGLASRIIKHTTENNIHLDHGDVLCIHRDRATVNDVVYLVLFRDAIYECVWR
jgi:hypothetical protein